MYICRHFVVKADGILYFNRKGMKVKFISLASGSSGNCYYLALRITEY